MTNNAMLKKITTLETAMTKRSNEGKKCTDTQYNRACELMYEVQDMQYETTDKKAEQIADLFEWRLDNLRFAGELELVMEYQDAMQAHAEEIIRVASLNEKVVA